MSCQVLFSRTHLPSAGAWQAMAASLPGDLQIDTDMDTASFEGWLPCRLSQGTETGFEYWLDALSLGGDTSMSRASFAADRHCLLFREC